MTSPLLAGIGKLDAITSEVVSALDQLGLAFPGAVESDRDLTFPADLTEVSLLELGELHSYWAAQYSRTTTIHGVVVAQKRSLKFEVGRLRAYLPSEDQIANIEERRRQLEAEYARVDAADSILNGVGDGQKRYADACSRELSRRQIEAQMMR